MAHGCGKHHVLAELTVTSRSQEGLQGRRGHNLILQNWTPALPCVRTLGKAQVYTEHSASPGQLNLAPKSQFSEHGGSREHTAARLPHRLLHRLLLALENPLSHSGGAHCSDPSSWCPGCKTPGVLMDVIKKTLKINLSSSASYQCAPER